jgi:hypothetical protein
VQLISGPGRSHYERGNLLFRSTEPGGDVLVKVYRQRKSRWRDFWGDVSEHWFERKRGVRAAQRRETEAAGLAVWRAAGFDVPRLLERARPGWIGDHPFLAMEFVDGPTLHQALEDPGRPFAERRALVVQLARDQARRHRCALERRETLLVHEHAMSRHVMVSADRLVTFDLEHAYRPGFPLPVAVAYELSSTLRSLERVGMPYAEAFIEGYAEPKILEESCRLFRSSSLRWRLYRRYEARHRGAVSKTAAMERLAARLGA